jgi:hypothetical protein
MLRKIKVILQLINIVVIIALLMVHFILKEGSYWDSLMFYSFPLPIIIFIVLILSIFLKKRKFNVILAGLLLIIWLTRSFKFHLPDSINEQDLEIVFWNASRDNNFEMALHENGEIPDIMVLTEAKNIDLEMLKSKFSNYYFYLSKRELFIFSKTPLVINSEINSKYNTTVIGFKTAGYNFYAVDVQGSLALSRESEIDFVYESINKKFNSIVLGDFNTPFESFYLNNFKTNFNHAFEQKGIGLRETWFYNLPILSLDHIWVSKDLKVLKTQKLFTTKSDHSMIKTFVRK